MLDVLKRSGLSVERSNLSANIAEGWVSYEQIGALAELVDVRQISQPDYPVLNTGSVTSQGDAILRVSQARSQYGVNGSGQKVCVISDGVDHWTSARDTGDLPSTIDVQAPGIGDAGTAMLEIIHDLAPGAALGFYGLMPSDTSVVMAAGIHALAAVGCTVIVDDFSFLLAPYYEDGIINQAVQDVLAAGVSYVGAAGNHAMEHYQATFSPGNSDSQMGTAHRWSGTDEGLTMQLQPGGFIRAFLQWNDRWGASGNDYDLYLFSGDMISVLASSTASQSGTGNPWEAVYYENTTASYVLVNLVATRWSGSPGGKLQLFSFGDGISFREYNVVAGSIAANHHTVGELACGAIAASNPGNTAIESFSSQGPVEHYFPVYEVRKKPDITGIDGVSVTGVGVFFKREGVRSDPPPRHDDAPFWQGRRQAACGLVLVNVFHKPVNCAKHARERRRGAFKIFAHFQVKTALALVP
jgi:hypothetical protein